MRESLSKISQVALLASAGLVAGNALASDGQIHLVGGVDDTTCTEVSINGGSSSAMYIIPHIRKTALTETVTGPNGDLKASVNKRDIEITLKGCPAGKKVAVSFDQAGYAAVPASATYRNTMLDSADHMATATKGVQIGFTKVGGTRLLMGKGADVIPAEDYKDASTTGVKYNFETRYVLTAANVADVTPGQLETVATFTVAYI